MEQKTINPHIISTGIPIIIILFVIFLLLKRFGLIRTREQRKAAKEKKQQKIERKAIDTTITKEQYFKPTYWRKVSANRLLPEKTARTYATNLRSALKKFGQIQATKVMAIFNTLTDKAQVSQLSFYYQANYERDMVTDLINNLKKAELLKLYNVTDAL